MIPSASRAMLLGLLLALPARAEEISFDQRSPFSGLEVQTVRYGLTRASGNVYQTSEEKFSVVVPESYEASAGWGLLVWTNPGDRGAVGGGDRGGDRGGDGDDRDGGDAWREMLAKKKLIGISAHNAGNRRGVGVRVGLALDAVHNLRQRYALDEKRTYIGGVSGGAKVAEMAAMGYPDVFDGAICCVGANWYKDTPVPGKPNTAWPATFRRPPMPVFIDAREHVGFVLITGEKDGNREPMKAMYDSGFLADKFKHVTFHDVPGMGHSAPPMEWMERAIDELDAIPKDRMKKAHPPVKPRPATTRATQARPVTTRRAAQ